MARAFIGVGSNLAPEANIRAALRLLAAGARITRISTFYRTAPIGRPEQPCFYNGVVAIETGTPPAELKRALRQIETRCRRRRTTDKYAPRTIDLDLLLYGDLVVAEGEVRLPDPEIETRAFLAVALLELAPDLRLPGTGRPIREIAEALDGRGLEPLVEYTGELRRELVSG
jgi:2-amino-4-hydroxy-6-hydroxymethyldihydropteridine diphosphokinase